MLRLTRRIGIETLAGGLLVLLSSGCGGDTPEDDSRRELPGPGIQFSPFPVSFLAAGPPSAALQYPAIADFDGDGKLDLVGYNLGDLYFVYINTTLGNGDGTFGPRTLGRYTSYDWGTFATADFNRDGKSDLVVAGKDHGISTPYLKSGLSDGSRFVEFPAVVGQSAYTAALIAADVDGDRVPDLLSYNSGTIPYLLKGNGTGRFGLPTGGTWKAVQAVAADINGDGTVDMTAAADMVTLRVDKRGTFSSVTLDTPLQGMAIADFNGDGLPDIALLQNSLAEANSEVRVMLGRGSFSLDPPLVTKLGQGPTGQFLVTGDFNGDGRADLAFTISDMPATGVLLGKGDGTFETVRTYEGNQSNAGLTAGDWNRDGKLDLVLGGSPMNSLLADSRGGLVAARTYRTPHSVKLSLDVDLDLDGDRDLVLVGNDTPNANTLQVSTLLNQGSDSFTATPVVTLRPWSEPVGATTGDFNEDGKPDAVLGTVSSADGGVLHMLLGKGDGTFAAPGTLPIPAFPYGLVAVDLNKDGHLDLLSANAGSSDIAILLGKGDGTFGATQRYPANYGATSPQFSDVNKDGNLDVVVLNQPPFFSSDRIYNMFTVLLGKGDGTVGPPMAVDLFTGYKSMRFDGFTINDWDRDGNVDLAVCATGVIATGPPTGDFQGLLLLKGDGMGGFTRGPLSALPDACPTLSGDVNGDGEADLVGSWKLGRSVLLSQGDGSFAAPTHVYSVAPASGGILADMNGDGKLDMVEARGRAVTIRLNTTP